MRPPWNCLPSCRPLWTDIYPTDVIWQWRDEWKSDPVVNSLLMDDATIRQPGFDLPRCHWALLNRFRPNQGHPVERSAALQQLTCRCSNRQTMLHIVSSCAQTKLEGGLQRLHSADDVATERLKTYGS